MNINDIAGYSVTEHLKDQRPVTIRAIRGSDKGLITEALRGLSPDSIYFRLFFSKQEFTDADLMEITDVDFQNVVALVAVLLEDGRERVVAEGRFIKSPQDGTGGKAEIAFLVDDAFQGRGIATLLLKHLTRIAREMGITHFEALVLRANQPMLAIFVRSGLPVKTTITRDVVYVLMDLQT